MAGQPRGWDAPGLLYLSTGKHIVHSPATVPLGASFLRVCPYLSSSSVSHFPYLHLLLKACFINLAQATYAY